MIYSNTRELLELLKRENLWAQKKLGQNFLVNPEALKNIVKAANLNKTDDVMEIGPGLGILTEQLSLHAGKVTCIEIDRAIIPVLRKNLGLENDIPAHTNIEILQQDALKTELPTQPYKLVANIPYYITSPILNHFLQPEKPGQQRPSLIVLLVQKEVAQKVCAKDGDHSILSLEVQAFGKPSIVCSVGRNSFFPQPNVDSTVLKIETYAEPKISDAKTFFKLIKAAFSQKRKTLSNSLKTLLPENQNDLLKIFSNADLDPQRRPQSLSITEWQHLVEAFSNTNKD